MIFYIFSFCVKYSSGVKTTFGRLTSGGRFILLAMFCLFQGAMAQDVPVSPADTGKVVVPAPKSLEEMYFAPAYSFSTGQENWCLAIADLNHDKRLDLISASRSSAFVQVLYGSGTALFKQSQSFSSPATNRVLVVTDLNKDGWDDIVTLTTIGHICIFFNDKYGGLKEGLVMETDCIGQSLALSDLDGDGIDDLCIAALNQNALMVFWGKAGAQFDPTPMRLVAGDKPRVVVAKDLNNDKMIDILVGCDDGNIYKMLNMGVRKFEEGMQLFCGTDIWGMDVLELNGDNLPDIVSASYQERSVFTFTAKADGSYVRSKPIVSGNHNFGLITGDFDLDGDTDVLTCSANDGLVSLHKSEGGGLLNQIPIQSGAFNSSVVCGDLDADGDLDVVSASINDKNINVHRNLSMEKKSRLPSVIGLTGVVFLEDGTTPVSFQPMTLTDMDGNTLTTTVTDEAGRYSIQAQTTQVYQLHVHHPQAPNYIIEVPMGDVSVYRELRLGNFKGATLRGSVTHERTGDPIYLATVEIHDGLGRTVAFLTTDKKGQYSCFLTPGIHYIVTVTHPNFVSSTSSFDVTPVFKTLPLERDFPLPPVTQMFFVTGTIYDNLLRSPLSEVDVLIMNEEGEEVAGLTTGQDANFAISLPLGKYKLSIFKTGYFYTAKTIVLKEKNEIELSEVERNELHLDMYLDRISIGQTLNIGNITYDKGGYIIRYIPRETLLNVIYLLQKNPTMRAEITGHTDSDGTEEGNQVLSEMRARTFADLLTTEGVDIKQLSIKGVGATQPIGDNSTEDGKQKNRRLEFRIIGL